MHRENSSILRYLSAILIILGGSARAENVELKAIIAHPDRFDGRLITTKGLAAIGGNGLYLFPDFETAATSPRHTRRAAYVPNETFTLTVADHRRWFALTGVVRSRRHGPSGENPCEIQVKSIRRLYLEKKVLWPEDIGVFRNATPKTVLIESDVPGGGSTAVEIRPNNTARLEIRRGGMVTIGDIEAGHVDQSFSVETRMQIRKRRPEDPSEREFQFTIDKNGLHPANGN